MDLIKTRRSRFQPCFGYYLQGAVKWICYTNIIQVLVGVVLVVREIFETWDDFQKEKIENKLFFTVRACVWSSYWLHAAIDLSLDTYLFRASRSRNTRGMLVWIVSIFFSSTWGLTVYVLHTYYFGFHVKTLTIYQYIGYLVYRYYTFYVVYSYIKEIRKDLNSSNSCRNLTDEEIQEFEDGLKAPDHFQVIEDPVNQRYSTVNSCHFKSEIPIETRVQYERYKKEHYEIPLHQLNIDETQELGAGAYGKVYRGHLNCLNNKSGSEETKLVAVKTINRENADVTLFKALLSELKVMSYLGKHEHVVSLLGACTTEIKFKKLYIVVEFCAFGSIYDYLRCNRGLFCSQVKDGQLVNESGDDYSNFEGDNAIYTKDLLKWCYQIADGMAYLEIKKVIHSDLAARNILLNSEKNVKITDFGLSRQLYQYEVYVKKQNIPLPWRWLAIESMTELNFSSKSDVWSFGVTVWELFSMGEAPWPGERFTFEFMKKLQNGMRMAIPTNCTHIIYNTLLLCWHEDPSTRPTFVALNEFFKSNYNYLI